MNAFGTKDLNGIKYRCKIFCREFFRINSFKVEDSMYLFLVRYLRCLNVTQIPIHRDVMDARVYNVFIELYFEAAASLLLYIISAWARNRFY